MSPASTLAQAVGSRAERYLRIRLQDNRTGVVGFERITEVGLLDPNLVTLLPGLPSPLLGLVNYRNRIYWLADLETACGMSADPVLRPHSGLIILAQGHQRLAVAVRQIRGRVTWSLSPLPNSAETEPPVVIPCLTQQDPDQLVYHLNIDRVLEQCVNLSQPKE